MVSKGILPWVASMLFSAATSEVLTCSDWLLGKDLDVIQPQHGNIDYLWNQLWQPLVNLSYFFIFYWRLNSG